MTTTLSEGVKVPDVGSVNWAGDLEVNWNLLNGALANLSGNVKLDRDNTWTGEQSFTLPIVGSITGTASKAIADEDGTSIKTGYVNVAGNQTVTGDKSFTGSNTFNNILPNATNTYSLGSSSYQWSSVYAQSYYYNGTAWGLDQTNTWTGYNTFTSYIALQESAAIPAGGYGKGIAFKDYQNNRFGYIQPCLTSDSAKRLLIGVDSGDIASNSNIIPNANNAVNLGTSTNKWKTLNGINPGALSLPNSPGGSGTVNINYIDLSGDITIRDASSANFYTAICDGWIAINSYATWIQIADDTTLVCVTGAIGVDGFGQCYLPVRKNDSVRIAINQTNTNFQSFKLIPCQGNV